jgi:hypothetical protein
LLLYVNLGLVSGQSFQSPRFSQEILSLFAYLRNSTEFVASRLDKFTAYRRALARACSINQGTVHEYLNRAAVAGVVWPLGEEWGELRVEQASFGELQVVNDSPNLPGFSRLAFAVAAASPSDTAVGLGRIAAGASRRIRLRS